MREAAERELGVQAKITTGSPGEMTVAVNGQNVFSYKKEGSLPATSELLRCVAAAGSNRTA